MLKGALVCTLSGLTSERRSLATSRNCLAKVFIGSHLGAQALGHLILYVIFKGALICTLSGLTSERRPLATSRNCLA
eukprot:5221820-Pyramimonas_sp.AAC.1